VIGIPLLVLRRNQREAYVRGNSVRLSRTQLPEVYAILEDHCRRLGIKEIPELFLTASTIRPYSNTYSAWRENYIILHQNIFDVDPTKTLDVVSFTLGHELGAIRLGHTAIWSEMLLTYVSTLKWLANPLNRIRVYSRDRYGAHLAPTGFRGLLIHAVGRRMLNDINIEDYLKQMREYGNIWAGLNTFTEAVPQVLIRIQELRRAGFKYRPPH
jgi:Zn-dependent protease with chaperone function